ncbi:MAG TPA: hypothetical protein VJL89_12665 [Thermodesulfovibrionia bacterium]|nr:hypothetical protein [Thermodesulfovibrionia bacterium]
MLSFKGIYENGEIKLCDHLPNIKKTNVIVTFLEETEPVCEDADTTLFDDLVGVISVRTDGSVCHTQKM